MSGRKVSEKKKRKQKWMWLEQIYYKIDSFEKEIKEIKKRLDNLEKKPCCTSKNENKDLSQLEQHLRSHFDAVEKAGKK